MLDRRFTMTISLRTALICTAVLIVAAFILGAGRGSAGGDSQTGFSRAFGQCMIPRTKIVEVDGMIARFDSATGAVHVMRGDPERGSGRVQWLRYVQSVGAGTSGLLGLDVIENVRGSDTLVLVDLVHGDTWVMRDRTRGANWQRVSARR